jgi:predicted Zn finger-like uncharacterized protein
MVITVTCPSCSSAFPVDPAKIPEGGVNVRCSSCGDIFRVEKPAPEPALPTLEEMAPEPVVAPPEPAPPAEPEPAPPVAEDPTPHIPAIMDEPPAEPEPAAPEPVAEAPPAPPEPEPEPVAAAPDPPPAAPEPEVPPAPAVDPFAEAAPFEAGSDEPAEAAPAAPAVQGFTFGKRDPTDKAKRLARVLVSDMIMYNAERHQSALAQGTLVQDFEEEIDKSWKEFVEQVGAELADGVGREFWTAALNDILAKGEEVF